MVSTGSPVPTGPSDSTREVVQNIPQRQPVSESEVTATSTSSLATLSAAQRTFGVPRFPEQISKMEGADFIRQSLLQKINVNGKSCFGDRVTSQQKSKGRKFYTIWTQFCKMEEDQKWYKHIHRPNPSDARYQRWERELRNFANRLIRELIDTHLPLYNELPNTRKRTTQNQGTTVGALVDMIQRVKSQEKESKQT